MRRHVPTSKLSPSLGYDQNDVDVDVGSVDANADRSSSRRRRTKTEFPVLLTAVCLVPIALFAHFFSAMGRGRATMAYARESTMDGTRVAIASLSIAALLWISDAPYWTSGFGRAVRAVGVAAVCVGAGATVVLHEDARPAGPLCALIACAPAWLEVVRWAACGRSRDGGTSTKDDDDENDDRRRDGDDGVDWRVRPLRAAGIVTIAAWAFWTSSSDDHEWDRDTRLRYAVELGCSPNFSSLPECVDQTLYAETGEREACFRISDDEGEVVFDSGCETYCSEVYTTCVHAFLFWANPFLAGAAMLSLSFACTFLNSGTIRRQRQQQKQEQQDYQTRLFAYLKVYLLLLFGLWCAASLAGAGEGLTTALVAYVSATVAAVGVAAVNTRSLHTAAVTASMRRTLHKDYGAYADVLRGLILVACAPLLAVSALLSATHQFVRRLGLPCSERSSDDETKEEEDNAMQRRKFLTDEASVHVNEFFQFEDRGKVYRYAVYWGFLYMSLQVLVQHFTVSFLSWLIRFSETLSMLQVTAANFAAGMFLFLFPPVPGGPIYIASGIMIVSCGRSTSLGLTGSILYTCGLSLVIKMSACALQQKVIGELLSTRVRVRQWAMINSRFVRAVRLVLTEEPQRLNAAKIAILVGGPDWPTSVLCGILKVDLLPVLLGTTPIIFIIVPMVLTGSFMFMATLSPVDGVVQYPWAGKMCALIAVITSVIQFGSMALAAHFVEKTISERGSDIERLPIDLEVQDADENMESVRFAYDSVNKWSNLPFVMKSVLTLSLLSMTTSCYLVAALHSRCFTESNLLSSSNTNDDGDDDATGGSVLLWGFVKPLGVVALSLLTLSGVLVGIFLLWAHNNAREIVVAVEHMDVGFHRLPNKMMDERTPLQHDIIYGTPPDRYGAVI